MRALLFAGLMASAVGCSSTSEGDTLSLNDAARPFELQIEGDDELSILPGEGAPLRVRLLDEDEQPRAGVEVEFGLTGSAEGASLEVMRVVTDRAGLATTTLTAGRAAPSFQVRASAPGADPVFFYINVVKATEPMLTVSVSYAGERAIKSNSVLVVENATCAELAKKATDVRMSYSLLPQESKSFTLGAGRSYAIAAWGSDDTNSKLAWGCQTYMAPVVRPGVASLEARSVVLTDLPLTVGRGYPLTFSLDLHELLSTLAPVARTAVAAALPKTATPEASFLLDALATKLPFAAARKSQGLDASLQAFLDAGSLGPLRFAAALAAAVAEDGATCLLSGALSPADAESNDGSFTLTPPIYAVPSDSVAKEVSLSAVPLKGVSEFSARYNQALAAVEIQAFKLALGFGSYATYLLDAAVQQPARYAQRVSASSGCSELGAWVAGQGATFSGLSSAQAVTTCEAAVAGLVPNVRAQWAALDQQRGILSLSGSIPAHDRTGDAVVDDLGPAELTGAWSSPGVMAEPLKVSVRMSLLAASVRY